MTKMRSGMLPNGMFSPLKFHDQIQTGEIRTFSTTHEQVIGVVHRDGFVEFAFWDEAAMACPGGPSYDEALSNLISYHKYYLGE